METENKMEKLTMTVESAGKLLGISRATAFLAVKTGRIPSIRISERRIIVPVAALMKMLRCAELEKDQLGSSGITRCKDGDGDSEHKRKMEG